MFEPPTSKLAFLDLALQLEGLASPTHDSPLGSFHLVLIQVFGDTFRSVTDYASSVCVLLPLGPALPWDLQHGPVAVKVCDECSRIERKA